MKESRVTDEEAPPARRRGPAGLSGNGVRLPQWLAALLGYLLLALGLTWPLALHLADRFPGDNPVDAWGHYWNMWWFRTALTRGQSPFYTSLWFAPEGVDLWLHTLAPFNSLMGLLPTLVAGPLVAYNVVVLANIALAGQSMFLLTRHLTGQGGAAFVAGLAFAASPYLMGHLNVGHLNVAALTGLPLFVYALLRAAEGHRRHLLLAALCLPLTALAEWHTLLFAGLAGAVCIGWSGWLALRRQGSWAAPLRMIAAHLLGAVAVLPLALVTARAVAQEGEAAELGDRWAERHSANLLAYLLPQDLHPLWGDAISSWRKTHLTEVLTEDRLSIGWTLLLLALIGLVALRWRAMPALALMALGIGLGLGPVLHVGTWSLDLPMPFDLWSALPYADISRTPARFSVLALLGLTLLAAFGAQRLIVRLREQRPGRLTAPLATGLLSLLLVGESLTAPYSLTVPPDTVVARRVGQEIAAADPKGTIFSLPYRRAEQERVFHQVHHERPIFGGFIPRLAERPFRLNTPGFADLSLARPHLDMFEPAADPLAVLNYYHVRYILLYRGEVGDDERGRGLRRMLQELLQQTSPTLTAADGSLEAWRVPTIDSRTPFVHVGSGWYPVEQSAYLGGRMRWMGEAAELYVERPVVSAATVIFTASSYHEPRRVTITANGQPLKTLTLATEPTEVRLDLPAASGSTRIVFDSVDGTDRPSDVSGARDNRPLSIALARVRVMLNGRDQPPPAG